MEFKVARLDRIASVTTISVTALLIGMSVFFILAIPYGWIWAIVMLSIPLFSYLLSPTKYVFEGSRLLIHKAAGKRIAIPLQDVEDYVIIPDFTKLRVSRTMGNGGLFGYYGTFSTAEYGTIICQLKRLKEVIIIKTRQRNYALSPADTARFEEYLVNTVRGLRGAIDRMVPRAPSSIEYAKPLIVIIPVLICILTIIMALTLYTRLPERIAVHFDIRGNPDRWSARTSFLTAGLVPAIILCAISVAVFSFIRKTTQKPALPYMIVALFALTQIFIAYAQFDTYWVNIYGVHIIAFPLNMIIYISVIALCLFLYFRKVKMTV